jgi:ketosteroid isomerase-like protein
MMRSKLYGKEKDVIKSVLRQAMPLFMVAGLLSSTAASAADKTEVEAKPAAASTRTESHVCTVSCTDRHASCSESEKVLDILEKLISAYSAGDIATYEKYLDDKCIVIDDTDHRVISGKANVLETLKTHFAQHAPGGDKPLISFHIDQPFAKVSEKGDTCVVTFVATKQVGGSKPHTERANVTDIFVKRGSDWKKLHWQGKWETVADN